MSCPDWRALVAARDAEPAADQPAWAEARHHAAQCGRCREEALLADPLLLFARLPERRATAGEIGEMQSAVAALVRAGRIAQGTSSAQSGRQIALRAAGSGLFSVTRVAAALGVCSLLAFSGAPRSRPAGLLGAFAVAGSPQSGQVALTREVLPLDSIVEELDRPGARIYELPQSDMAVVMIVDASLDV
ncbi:MAG: hypothetical protein ABI689_14115 [Thermoanaerobaculia bacterium]